MTTRWLTVGKAAKELGLAPATIRKLCQEGKIHGAKRIGHWWRIPENSVAYIKEFGLPVHREEEASRA